MDFICKSENQEMNGVNPKNARILLVDDNPRNIQVLGTILKHEGYQIIIAQNGCQAIKAVKKAPPDLILLDIMMPQMDGFETCKKLKQNAISKEIPIIFLTAKADTEDIVKGFELGAVDYITKPFNSVELLSRVKTHMELSYKRKLQGVIEMAGAVCHEMNQPLQTILGYSELILLDIEPGHPLYKKLVNLKKEIEKMGKITRNLMQIIKYKTFKTKNLMKGQKIIDIDRSAK